MKKLLLASLALALLASCAKDDQGGIPPVDGTGQANENVPLLQAATATATDYVVGKKVKLHGNIVIERNRPYFKFSDNTLVQIYAQNSVSNTLSEAAKTKLSTSGQEITVTGTFTNFTPRNSTEVVKEIVYTAESDLVFGTTPAPQPITDLEATTATATDYVVGKKVKLRGNIVVQANHPYFKFSDNTLVQIYAQNSVFNTLSEAAKTKLSTSGQEITVTGTFTNFTPRGSNEVIKEIVYTAESDLVFGTTPAQNQPQPSQGKIFDFEQITSSSNGYNITGTLQTTEGVSLSYKGRTDLKDDKNTNYAISGKGLMLTDHRDKPYIKITFPNGVRKLFIDYKGAYKVTQNRHFEIYEGDENSTQKIGEHSFAYNASGTFSIDLNKTGAFTLTIKPATGSKQFVLDNIKYEN